MAEFKIDENTKLQVDKDYKLTAIVLVYNGGRFLRACINSLVEQTLDDLEILLVNDVSTDDSLAVCREFEREYDNVFIIDKFENGGLASSANLGIRLAKGEYVILVDNDDIVPPEAYEKLYTKAKETDADVCVGSANFLFGHTQQEIHDYENNVWEKEVTVDPKDYPLLFHETFYWNKIMRRSMLIDNNIELPESIKVYCDRKFSHTVYTYAKTVSVIMDCVYLWRIRLHDKNDESLSMRRKEAWNYVDRIDSFELELDRITDFYPDYFKILMRRVVIPVKGILNNKELENIYFERGYKILKEECAKLDNLYDNDLKNMDNILIYLTLNKYWDELIEFLKIKISDERDLYSENGKTYWNLPLFRNPDIDIPDELFEIKTMIPQFFSVDEVIMNDDVIRFEGIELPRYIKTKRCEIQFNGRTNYLEKFVDNSFAFEMQKVEDDERNIYRVEIPTSQLRLFEVYDIYFKVYFEDRPSNHFRLSGKLIDDVKITGDNVVMFTTVNDNLSIGVQRLYNNFEIKMDEEGIYLLRDDVDKTKNYLKAVVRDVRTGEKTYFSLNEEDQSFYFLKWKYFLDKNALYSLNFVTYDEKGKYNVLRKIDTCHLTSFKQSGMDTDVGIKVNMFENENSEIFLKS